MLSFLNTLSESVQLQNKHNFTDPQQYFPQVRRQTSSSHALVGNGAIVNVFTHLTVCSFRFSSGAAHCGRYLSDIGPQTVPCQVQKEKRCRYPNRHLQCHFCSIPYLFSMH